MTAAPARDQPRGAGVDARASAVHVFSDGCRTSFETSEAGLSALSAWLVHQGVRHVALLQGAAWPWQAERARRLKSNRPIDLGAWVEFRGEGAWRLTDEEAWQPVYLALRDDFTVFLATEGGAYPVTRNRDTAEQLARLLAAGQLVEAYPAPALHRLIDRLSTCEAEAVDECVSFFEQETRGYWHNRARAKIARRLKHCELSKSQSDRIIAAVSRRLISGNFTEQFKDQLSLMLHLDGEHAFRAGEAALKGDIPHAERYAHWLLSHRQLRG